MPRHVHKLLCLIIALSAALAATAETAVKSRNLILIIGDGFDDQHVTMGRNYLVGMSGKLILDTMPYRASVQVETVSEQGQPLYVADSANTATSLATGGVTQIGRIATDIEDNDLNTIAERARDTRVVPCACLGEKLRRPRGSAGQHLLRHTAAGLPR